MLEVKDKTTKDPDKLLRLIKDGDAEMLLDEGDLGKGFNKLIQLELISIEEGKVLLTPLGEEALEEGIERVASRVVQAPEVQPVIVSNPITKSKLNRKMWLLAILLLLFMLVLLSSQMLN